MSTRSIQEIFDTLHKSLETRYMANLSQQRQDAACLQNFFTQINRIQKKLLTVRKSIPSGRGFSRNLAQAEAELRESFKTQDAQFLFDVANESLTKRSAKSVFSKMANKKSENLEKPMAGLIQAVAHQAFSQHPPIKAIMTGKILTNLEEFSLENIDEDLKKNFLEILVQEVGKKASRILYDNNEIPQSVEYSQKSIKTDLAALEIDLEIQRKVSPKIQRAIDLINNSNLSVKNYSSFRDISLGSTKLWKSYSLVAKTSDLSDKEIVLGYIVYHELKNKNDEFADKIKNHMNHIRFVYELTGQGQTVGLGENRTTKDVDFLVVNKPDATDDNGIRVYSVKQLIMEQLNRNDLTTHLEKFSVKNPFK